MRVSRALLSPAVTPSCLLASSSSSLFSHATSHQGKDSAPDLKLRAQAIKLGGKLGISPDDLDAWYSVQIKDILDAKGNAVITPYRRSLYQMLVKAFPDHPWDPGKFSTKPRNFWKPKENQRTFLERIRTSLGIKDNDYEAWYKVTTKEVSAAGGSVLLTLYGSSLSKMLKAIYTEYNWDLSKFRKKPQSYWKDEATQRKFMLDLGAKLGIKERDYDGWYKITSADVMLHGGTRLIKSHKSSMATLLRAVFPEHNWDDAKFTKKPQRFWKSRENQKNFLESLRVKLGLKEGDYAAWYRVTQGDILEHGGGGLLGPHNFSLYSLLRHVYPEHDWDPSKFLTIPRYALSAKEEQRRVLDEIGKQLGIKDGDFEAWYRYGNMHILQHGGGYLLSSHKSSLFTLLTTLIPEHSWDESKFTVKRRFYWRSKENQRKFIEEVVAPKLGILKGEYDKWYDVTSAEIVKAGGSTVFMKYYNGSVSSLVTNLFPEHAWQLWKFGGVRSITKNAADAVESLSREAAEQL